MPEFTYNPVQRIEAGQNAILNTTIGCCKGYVLHRNESGIVILCGIVNNPTGCLARYQVTFNGNIARPSYGTAPAPISLALTIDGEPIQTSKAIVTPAAVTPDPPTNENYFNVTSTAIMTVPKGCCFTVAVENTSTGATATTPAPAINMQNANLTVDRIA